ncbi:response to drug-related protein [Rhizoctonia solani AG-1 IA]|uniref:Response to drug-related protein n=1 Tax=Thanatephorus cucumeris (strain AG1-IA) TaxID=983506 RepID=L8WJK0_THACA|nr:response to drug-related protein [Rhizoctonia solani AG-1 IA]
MTRSRDDFSGLDVLCAWPRSVRRSWFCQHYTTRYTIRFCSMLPDLDYEVDNFRLAEEYPMHPHGLNAPIRDYLHRGFSPRFLFYKTGSPQNGRTPSLFRLSLMSDPGAATPTLMVGSSRQSAAMSTQKMSRSRDTLMEEEEEERQATNTDELRPAEGPGSRAPVPDKFAHTGTHEQLKSTRGSLARSATHAPSLTTWVIDRDGGEIGQSVVQGLLETTRSGSKSHLGWRQLDPNEVSDVAEAVIDEKAWGAVVMGNSSYNPTTSITFYYAQARNELATGNYVVPLTTAALTQASERRMKGTTRKPQAIQVNLQSICLKDVILTEIYSAPVATALTLVELLISKVQTMTNDAARGIFGPFLRLRSYLYLRILVPLGLYFPLSLAFAMVSLPFHAPFGTKYTYAGGFFLYFVYTYMGMCALGLATEAMVTILTPSNNTQSVRTILFNTKNHLGLNAGVILAWIVLSLTTIPLFTVIMRRRDERAHERELAKQQGTEKLAP